MEDHKLPGALEKAQDDEIQILLDKYPCQIQQQLANQLGIAQQAVSIQLQAIGKI